MPPAKKKQQDDDGPVPPFQFTHGDATFSIPALGEVKAGVMRALNDRARIAGWSQVELTWQLFDEIADPAAIEALGDLPTREFDKVCGAYMKHSGVGLGES